MKWIVLRRYSEKTPYLEWHDLRMAPDDLPEHKEQILTTTENWDGGRRIHTDIYLKELDDYHYSWCILDINEHTGLYEECACWEEVVAWAYLPDPYSIQREKT